MIQPQIFSFVFFEINEYERVHFVLFLCFYGAKICFLLFKGKHISRLLIYLL